MTARCSADAHRKAQEKNLGAIVLLKWVKTLIHTNPHTHAKNYQQWKTGLYSSFN